MLLRLDLVLTASDDLAHQRFVRQFSSVDFRQTNLLKVGASDESAPSSRVRRSCSLSYRQTNLLNGYSGNLGQVQGTVKCPINYRISGLRPRPARPQHETLSAGRNRDHTTTIEFLHCWSHPLGQTASTHHSGASNRPSPKCCKELGGKNRLYWREQGGSTIEI